VTCSRVTRVLRGLALDVETRRFRWIATAFAVSAVGVVGWTFFLARSLPNVHDADHWRIAWVGFDIGLAIALAGVALAAYRRSPWLEGVAAGSAALLVCDAWFDVLSSRTHRELLGSIALAACIELPAAVVCFLIARGAERSLVRFQRDDKN
jgi:hypothetical protein